MPTPTQLSADLQEAANQILADAALIPDLYEEPRRPTPNTMITGLSHTSKTEALARQSSRRCERLSCSPIMSSTRTARP